MNEPGFLYLLKSEADGSFYLGSTKNFRRRYAEHNQGKNASTRGKIPWELSFLMRFTNISEARSIEQKIKRRKEKITLPHLYSLLAQYLS